MKTEKEAPLAWHTKPADEKTQSSSDSPAGLEGITAPDEGTESTMESAESTDTRARLAD